MFTDGDRAGEWTGLENYRSRVFTLHRNDVGKRTYLPIAEFGRRVLRSDGYHPDAEGYAMIAEAVLGIHASIGHERVRRAQWPNLDACHGRSR